MFWGDAIQMQHVYYEWSVELRVPNHQEVWFDRIKNYQKSGVTMTQYFKGSGKGFAFYEKLSCPQYFP